MLVYAERLPSSPAELSAIVRIAAKRSPRNWKRSSTIISPHSAPSVSTTGRSSRLRCKPASTQDSQHQLMPNGRFAPKAAIADKSGLNPTSMAVAPFDRSGLSGWRWLHYR
jgi:hypothetical protein